MLLHISETSTSLIRPVSVPYLVISWCHTLSFTLREVLVKSGIGSAEILLLYR